MAGNKARLVRLSPTQWENVDLFGGLGKIVRDYLVDHADEKATLANARLAREAQKKDVEDQLTLSRKEIQILGDRVRTLEDRKIKLDIELVGLDERIKTVVLKEQGKSGVSGQEIKAKALLLHEKKRKAIRVKTPGEWERESKLALVMQHAATGTLSAADEARIVQKMKIKPEDIAGWLYSLKPEHISLEHLGKARYHDFPNLPNLQVLKAQDKIKEPFYALLMMWLSLPTPGEVDAWIMQKVMTPDNSKETSTAGEVS
ncbi:MAG: hypothetical protein J5U19_13715 [Candidatus Methanoperedens sp.]|nr:hypothetical protein [Candidatus Methanoperedens sp.]